MDVSLRGLKETQGTLDRITGSSTQNEEDIEGWLVPSALTVTG